VVQIIAILLATVCSCVGHFFLVQHVTIVPRSSSWSTVHGRAPVPLGPRLRNDLYCVGWGVKLYSLTRPAGPHDLRFEDKTGYSWIGLGWVGWLFYFSAGYSWSSWRAAADISARHLSMDTRPISQPDRQTTNDNARPPGSLYAAGRRRRISRTSLNGKHRSLDGRKPRKTANEKQRGVSAWTSKTDNDLHNSICHRRH